MFKKIMVAFLSIAAIIFHFVFVCVDAKHSSLQFFSHVGTELLLSGYYQLFSGSKYETSTRSKYK